MQINELLDLTFWVDKNIKNETVPQKYQQLQAVLQQNVNARNNQPQQPFLVQKEALVSSIQNISTDSLTNEQERMLEKLNISTHVGSKGVEQIEEILFKNTIDIATAAAEINKLYSQINTGVTTSNQIQANLQPLIETSEEDDEDMDNSVVMSVHFQNEVAMKNVTDFKNWGNAWWEIGRGIAMAHDHAPEDIKVIGAHKGSIIIELAVVAAIAKTTSSIILSALKVADKYLTVRKKAEEIKALKLGNEKLVQDIESEAKKVKEEGLEEITKTISIKLDLNVNGDGEKIKVLKKAIKNLIAFVEKGGEIDFYTGDSNDETSPDIQELKINFKEIKRLEKKVMSIENNNL